MYLLQYVGFNLEMEFILMIVQPNQHGISKYEAATKRQYNLNYKFFSILSYNVQC
jgi:hypothetical protein